jgi:hypothetical protein
MKTKLISLLTATLLVTSIGSTALSANQTQKKTPTKPFLIQGKLPHLTMMVKILWNDEDLALTKDQKSKLLIVRKETVTKAKALGKKINKLESEIVKASNNGINPTMLKEKVYKLASLRTEATMIHLKCIYNTRKILTKEQLEVLE